MDFKPLDVDYLLVDNNIVNQPPRKNLQYTNKQKKDYNYLKTIHISSGDSNVCYWDCHEFCGQKFGLPISYDGKNNSFKLWGNFCSLECARAFAFDDSSVRSDSNQSLIALMGVKLYGRSTHIRRAPSKFLLKMFGGPLTIEEFRSELDTPRYWVVNRVNCGRTQMVCDVYYRETMFTPYKPSDADKDATNDKPKKTYEMELRRNHYPAHQTKNSLKNLLGKRRKIEDYTV